MTEWRVLRGDEDLGPGCYEVGITAEGAGPHPPPPEPDSHLVPATASDQRIRELETALEQIVDHPVGTAKGGNDRAMLRIANAALRSTLRGDSDE